MNIPRPSNKEINKWLNVWEKETKYKVQEKAVNELFINKCPENKNIVDIIIKCSVLNDFYSTNIFKIYDVAMHIMDLNIDNYIKNGDFSIVNEIAKVTISGKEKNFYSFATKYCSHSNQDIYPIYDSFVDKMLRNFQKKDKFYKKDDFNLKDYETFVDIIKDFRHYYDLCNYSLRELDLYLWLAGKKYFQKPLVTNNK